MSPPPGFETLNRLNLRRRGSGFQILRFKLRFKPRRFRSELPANRVCDRTVHGASSAAAGGSTSYASAEET